MSTPTSSSKPLPKRKSSANGTPKEENGRFDFGKTESEVELVIADAPVLNARGYVDDNPVGGLDDRALLAKSQVVARRVGARLGLDPSAVEELGQDSLVEIYEKNEGYVRHGALVTTVASSLGIKLSLKKKKQNGTDGAARKEWLFECGQESQLLQRSLTKAEADALAEEIRAFIKMKHPRNYPSEGYQYLKPADTEIDNPDLHIGATLVAREPDEFIDDEDGHQLADDAQELISAKKSVAVARRKAWNALAKIAGAPPATVGTVAKAHARKAAKTVTNAADVAARWLDEEGVTTPAETAAFFLPYGVLTEDEKVAAAKMIADRPQLIGPEGKKKVQGHVYWQAALECSNSEFYPQS